MTKIQTWIRQSLVWPPFAQAQDGFFPRPDNVADGVFISKSFCYHQFMEIVLKSHKDTQKIAGDIVKKLIKKSGPLIIALYGDLGSGKTTFAQFFAKALGIREKILSPTFVVIKTFSLDARIYADLTQTNADKFGYKKLVHIDTYRLKSAKDLVNLGFKEMLKDKESIILIEWPEKIERYLPKNTIRIYFDTINDKERKLKISNV